MLVNFSLNTNPTERNRALIQAKGISGAFIVDSVQTPRKYRKLTSDSKFVLSPPGNGADCHRTWEAIYLGAIPIVLRKFWPFIGLDLPVIVLDSWEELEGRIENFQGLKYLEPLQVIDEIDRITNLKPFFQAK